MPLYDTMSHGHTRAKHDKSPTTTGRSAATQFKQPGGQRNVDNERYWMFPSKFTSALFTTVGECTTSSAAEHMEKVSFAP